MATPRFSSHSSNCGTSFPAALLPGFDRIPTALMSGIQQKLAIAFGSANRAFHNIGLESERLDGDPDARAGRGVQRRIADNTPLSDLAPFDFELRFYENNHFAIRTQ